MILYFIFIESWIKYDARHSFFLWMRTGSYPPDSNEYEKIILTNLQLRRSFFVEEVTNKSFNFFGTDQPYLWDFIVCLELT